MTLPNAIQSRRQFGDASAPLFVRGQVVIQELRRELLRAVAQQR